MVSRLRQTKVMRKQKLFVSRSYEVENDNICLFKKFSEQGTLLGSEYTKMTKTAFAFITLNFSGEERQNK